MCGAVSTVKPARAPTRSCCPATTTTATSTRATRYGTAAPTAKTRRQPRTRGAYSIQSLAPCAGGAELHGPPLPADDVALAVEVYGGHEAVVKQLMATAGADADSKDEDGRRSMLSALRLSCLPSCRAWTMPRRRSVEDLYNPPAVQLLGVRTNVPGVHGALAVLWVKDFRKANLVDLSTVRNSRLWSCLWRA
jgi:hypothetical protein